MSHDLFGYLPASIRDSRFLREGHNTVKERRNATGVDADGKINVTHRKSGAVHSTSADNVSRSVARRAIKQDAGVEGSASTVLAKERPVLAAKIAANKAGLKGKARRQSIRTARKDENSARSERRFRRNPPVPA